MLWREIEIMIKKFLTLTFLTLVIIIFSNSSNTSFANYPTHLNGDKNYILVDGHMGVAWYVDRSSLKVKQYLPPHYIITIEVVSAESAINDVNDFYSGGRGIITGRKLYHFAYHWDSKHMYLGDDSDYGAADWKYIDPRGSWADTGIIMPAGEMAFALAYNMKFYGTLTIRYSDGTTYPVYSDDFYSRI